MDSFTLPKFGDVTIQRIPPKSDDTKAKFNEPVQSVSQQIQLPKLPPSINITLKSSVSTTDSETERKHAQNNEVKYANSAILKHEAELNERDTKPDDSDNETESKNNVDSLSVKLNEQNTDEKCDSDKTESSDVDDYTESNQKMEFATDSELRLDSLETALPSDKISEDEEFVEPSTIENEYKDDAQEDLDELPAIPIDEFTSDELPEDIKEQFSDKESSSESEDADDEYDKEMENSVRKKKKKRKSKVEDETDNDSNEMKKQKTIDEEESSDEGVDTKKSELKVGNLRRNIREVMDETKLEEATLAAQRQEMERLRRVQEQQRIIRELAQSRQNNKMQARVLSFLSKGATSIIKKEEEEYEEEEFLEEKKPNTVLVKLSTGSGPPQLVNKKVLDLLKQSSSLENDEDSVAKEKLVNLSKNLDKPQMMTASVSIAPIKQEPKPKEIVSEKEEEKPKGKDVVMISSSSDEEDCIVISEEESEPEEDTTNSGMHTNDLYNVPDEQGRVLINVGHPESEKDVFLAPQIARIIKPHQIGGVRFLFDNIVESLNRYKTSEGFGCILAHSMGLGKTLQVVSFCDVFLRYTEGRTVMCIMPINTLQNWMAEFNMWLPTDPENSALREQGEVFPRQFPIFLLNDNQKTLSARANVIQNWNKEGGVLLIGYELYRQLSLKKPPKSRTRSKRKTEAEEDLEDEKCKNLLEIMYSALVKPGPDLVICDEGHRIKNSHASISQALKQIRSKRRVVLTGYPLQNNLLEYWCMVDFVRPNYLGTKTEFSNMFERPIQNGQCIDSTPQDIKLMRYRAHVLHSLLEGFVQRRSHSVLQQTLPNKYEFVLLLRLTPLQRELYNTFMNEVVRTKAVPNPLKAFAVCCKIWNHPDILYNFLKKRAGDEELDLDIDEASASIGTPASGPSTPVTPSTPPHQANKRSRSGRGAGKGKEAKLPRKNARTSTPQPINKTPSIAAVPPNTANNVKPVSPDQAITNRNNQPIPPFNSYNNQFQNFNQQNENFNEFNQSGNSNQNYNNQYNQEYSSPNVANSQEYNNTNYQQNYSENNYFQSEFNQNNYWQGNNEGGNFYNNNMSSSEEYYQQNSNVNASQYSGSDYNTNTENVQGNFNDSNYGFDMNSQMNYSNEFAVKQENNVSQFGVNENEMLLEGNNDVFSGMSNDDMNFRTNQVDMCGTSNMSHFGNQSATTSKNSIDNASIINNAGEQNQHQNLPSFNPDNRNVNQMSPRLGLNNENTYNTFGPGQSKGTARMPASRPLVRSGAVGRPRKNANNNENSKFKPGLPGGAPIMKSNINEEQDFQNISIDNQTHVLTGQISPEELNAYAQNPIGTNFIDTLRSEELWNPNNVDQGALFQDQNFIYEETGQMANSQSSFIGNEAPSLLGGVRATNTLLNEIQSTDSIFSGVQQGYSQDNNLFNLDNFTYLNELQTNYRIPSQTSFMGLLEGEDNLQMENSALEANTKNNQFSVQPNVDNQMNKNFIENNLPFTAPESNASGLDSSDLTVNRSVNTATDEKVVNQSIRGLARSGQITLKVVEKKNESQPKLSETNPELPKPSTSGGATEMNSSQNRLPSIDIFNTSQNFVSSARLNQETANYSQIRQFSYSENQNVANNSNQSNWENFENSDSNDFSKQEKSFFNQNQMIRGNKIPTQSGKKEDDEGQVQMALNDDQITLKKESFNNPFSGTPINEISKDDSRRLGANTEQKKQEEKPNKNFFLSTPKVENNGTSNKPQPKMNSISAISGNVVEKKQPLRRNVPSNKMDLSKQLPSKNENVVNLFEKEPQKSQFLSGVNVKSATTVSSKVEPKEMKSEELESDDVKMPAPEVPALNRSGKEEPGIPYDWTEKFFRDYDPGKIEASAKTLIFFCMLEEIIRLGDRLLLFSQSLFTLDLIEDFLHMYNIPGTEEKWARNRSYFRLDGSTSALEREKLINEFNSNPNVHLFLVSTRAGSLGINLVGANRVVVFDASWNPCHDTQAVCRVYRYGQQKPCYVYRFVMDNCLEKKIYDRQINKQGMSDRVVDECNPDAHLTIKDVSNLCWDNEDVSDGKRDFREFKDKYNDGVIQTVIEKHSPFLSKEPFQHESLLVDRKDKQLSQAEKRMAKRSYEMEKRASLRPSYGFYNNPHAIQNRMGKPMASVRPMPVDNTHPIREGTRRWIPAEVWQKQGMTAQEMTLPIDIVIPTNTPDTRSSIVLKEGQKVMVLKSPKGIYMQLENGKIIAIKTAMKNALGNGKPGMPRGMPNNPAGIKMLLRPPIERPIPSMGGRRDVTVSPIRNRFVGNMRTNPNMGLPGMRPSLPRGPRPGQPIVRTFPLPRPQGRPVRQPISTGKPIFGSNSSVTISLANKKKDNQEHPHLTEVNYEDYNLSRLKDIQSLQLNRKYEEEIRNEQTLGRRSQYTEYQEIDDNINPRMMETVGGFSGVSDNYKSSSYISDVGLKMNTPVPGKFMDNSVTKNSKISDIISESLRFKKDINLTPVRPTTSALKGDEKINMPLKSIGSDMTRKMNPHGTFQTQTHYLQQKQLGQKIPGAIQFSSPSSLNMKRRDGVVAPKTEVPKGKSIKETSLRLPGIKNDLATKSNSQHSISIFPINKKTEDSRGEAQGQGFEENVQNQNYHKGNFYGQYRDFPAESPQYSNPYSSNFSSQPEYHSQQHSYGSSQYSSVPYSTHEYGSSSFTGEEPQYGSVFSNQTPTSSGTFGSYDQYGNYFNAQNYPSKTEISQHSNIQSQTSQSQP